MLATIYTKSLRDRWLGGTIGAAVIGLLLAMGMSVYRDIDLRIYDDLPDAMKELMGIPAGADAASLAYNVMLGTIASLVLAGLAISMGSAAIAGEERDGTIGVLLANPRSRRQVLVSKAASMATLIVGSAALMWVAARLTPALLGVDIGDTRLGAMAAHLAVNALFYGFLALAIGAWTGSASMASAAPTAVMAFSFVATGILPLIDAVASGVKLVPWYYFDGSRPLVHGLSPGHLAVLGAGIAVFAVVALVGVGRRDLRGPTTGVTMLDRLRRTPLTKAAFDRLAGSTRVSRPWVKATSDHQAVLIITALLMFTMMGVLMGPMYTFIDDAVVVLSESLPETMLALFGSGDMSTPQGFLQLETFGLMAPIAVMVVTVVVGSKALAGEEADGTMSLLLANPISRTRVVVEAGVAMLFYAVVVGLATWSGTALGVVLAGLDVSVAHLGATSVLVTLLGLVFGALALLLSAATGRTRAAVYGTIGVALVAHVTNAFLPLSDRLAVWARLSPFHWYLSSDPLNNGLPWAHAAVLTGLAASLFGLAVVTFERRDLRSG